MNDEMNPAKWLRDHGDALFAFAMMRLQDASAAEDMIQETLVAGIQGLAQFKQGASVRTWLISIMKNKIVDYLRKRSREHNVDSRMFEDESFAEQFSPDGHWKQVPRDWQEPSANLQSSQTKQQLLNCIGELPERLRTLIVLKEIDGFETTELIEMLNISSANNLWVMLSRGRDSLRRCMDRYIA